MPSSPAISESVAEQAEIARLKSNKVRETIERLHSQSTDLLQLAVQWKDLECRFDSIQKSIDDRVGDLNKKEMQLEWKSKFLKKRWSEIGSRSEENELREKALEAEKKELDDRCVEVDHTYQLVAMCHARAEETAQGLEEKLRSVKSKETRLVSKLKSFERKEKRLIVKRGLMKRKFRLLKNRSDELVLREKRLDDCVAWLNLREKKLNSIERGLLENIQEFEPREKKLEDTESELRRRETSFRERYKVFINNERCLNSVLARFRGEEVVDADIRFYITMNGRDLVGFLSSRADDLEIMRDEVTRALKLSSNPARLVLDAMQGFYGGYSGENFDLSIVRRSCIVLLEQLTELEPQIGVEERERARLLALEWKARMTADIYHNLEVVAFLQLVGAYRLTNGFDKDELAKTIASAAHHTRAPAFCRRLGLEDKVHDIVLHLIQDMHAVEAVRFIHEFNLMDTLPPAPILRNYLEKVVSAADNISTEQPTDMIVSALITVIKCIKEFKLDSEYPTASLEEQVLDLQRQKCCSSSEEPPTQLQNSSSTANSTPFPVTGTMASYHESQ